jgi:flavin reductase (DIM6/NTAB) family NADH-FMN oxidoreductase RutF
MTKKTTVSLFSLDKENKNFNNIEEVEEFIDNIITEHCIEDIDEKGVVHSGISEYSQYLFRLKKLIKEIYEENERLKTRLGRLDCNG